MTENPEAEQRELPVESRRRSLLKNIGLGFAGAAAVSAAAHGRHSAFGIARQPRKPRPVPCHRCLNILNLALEPRISRGGILSARGDRQRSCPSTAPMAALPARRPADRLVPFQNTAIANMAQKIAVDEQSHV